ncbi:MAG TPA: serine/threonine-protein kinase [Gemmataceae bacterium]|jgi:serine/threonine protein kinase/Tfp pilus assembly protein PilF
MTALLTDLGDADAVAALSATAVLDGPPPPALAPADRSRLIDRAFAEFMHLRTAGVEVDPDAFCGRYPAYQTSLRRVLEVRLELEANPSLLDGLGAWPECGEEFFGFHLEAELGRGAFARVYLAREPAVGNRRVVVKVSLHADNEAGTLGKFRHPNVVPIHSAQFDETTGFAVVCMPFLGGTTLSSVVESLAAAKALPDRAGFLLDAARDDRWPADSAAPPVRALRRGTYLDAVLHLGERMAAALAYVHERGILHRDLKPSNVLLCPNGEPVLIDFNLALDRTMAEHRLGGTLPYMPPEQLAALAAHRRGDPVPADDRSDLYALGVILYELLTGVHPFGPVPLKLATADACDFLLTRQRGGPRPLRARNRQVDPALDRLIRRCLSADPADRPASAAALAAELRRLQAPGRRARRWAVAHVKVLAMTGALAACGAAGYVANQPVPSSPAVVHAKAGEQLYQDGQYAAALQEFDASLAADPDQPAVYFARGRVYQKQGQWASAIQDFTQCVQSGGDADGRAAACLGYCYACVGRYPRAVESDQQAIRAGTTNLAAVYNNLSLSQLRMDRNQQAEESAELALKLDPNLRAAHYNCASARLKLCSADPNEDPLPGLQHVRAVLSTGIPTAKLYWTAAMLCAAELGRRGDGPDADRLDDEGAKYVRLAVEFGYSRQTVGYPIPRFRRMAEWAKRLPVALPAKHESNGLDDNIRLIDPMTD